MAAMAAMAMLMMGAVTWGTGALLQHQCEAAVTGTHWSTVYPQGFWLARFVGCDKKVWGREIYQDCSLVGRLA